MYGYVNNRTGEFHLFGSLESAGDHAREAGLTSVRIRPVVAHDGVMNALVNERTRAAHAARVPAGVTTVTLDEFLAGGR